MADPLWGTMWKISAGALAVSLVAAMVFVALGRTLDGVGLVCGAFLSAVNFLATSRFVDRARRSARGEGVNPSQGGRAAMGFILRYVILALILVALILGAGLPPTTTVLGFAAVPLTIYLWQMGLLVTGRWRNQF